MDWYPAGNNHVPWTGEALFSFDWQSHRDGVSIKLLVVVQPKKVIWLFLKWEIKLNPTTAWMRLKLQLKVSRPSGVLLASRMGPVIIELLLIGGQGENNGLRKTNAMLLQ